MNRGEVFWVSLPFAGQGGHEQSGRRPAVIVQSSRAGQALSTVVVVPLTSNMAALKRAHSVAVVPSAENGLTVPSVALVSQLRAVDVRRLEGKVGLIDAPTLADIETALKAMLF